jgi:hypothetical protein
MLVANALMFLICKMGNVSVIMGLTWMNSLGNAKNAQDCVRHVMDLLDLVVKVAKKTPAFKMITFVYVMMVTI